MGSLELSLEQREENCLGQLPLLTGGLALPVMPDQGDVLVLGELVAYVVLDDAPVIENSLRLFLFFETGKVGPT